MKWIAIICLCLASVWDAGAQTNSLVWRRDTDRVEANIHDEPLLPLLEQIAKQAGWRVFIEPSIATNTASAKFKNLSAADALRMLLGNVNFVIEPPTNGETRLYVFHTAAQNATQAVLAPQIARHLPNELLVKLKPGANIDALAKLLGAKVIARNDKLGIYRLQFSGASATDAALAQLKTDSNVEASDYNYILDPPPAIQPIENVSGLPPELKLSPTDGSGKLIVGLIDTAVQPLDGSLNSYLLKPISVADGSQAGSGTITHGTAMAYDILQASGGIEILPVDAYGSSETTTSWNVAVAVQQAVDGGAKILSMSLSGPSENSILADVIAQAKAAGITIFAASGNNGGTSATYPAAFPGVNAVTALSSPGQIASYANYGAFVDMALPGSSVVYFGGQSYLVQGTSPATAYASGIFAGNMNTVGGTAAQIIATMQKKFPVPTK